MSILNNTYRSALNTQVQNLSLFSLCPVFVDVQDFLQGQAVEQLVVRSVEGRADLLDQFRQISAGNLNAEDVPDEFPQRGKRDVAHVFHVGHKSGKPLLEETLSGYVLVERHVVDSAAFFTPHGVGAVFEFDHRRFRQLDLLDYPRSAARRKYFAAAVRTARMGEGIENVYFVGGEKRTLVPRMAGLAADFPFFVPVFFPGGFGLYDIVGRRTLAAVRRVFRKPGDFVFQRLDLVRLATHGFVEFANPVDDGLRTFEKYFQSVLRRHGAVSF